MREDCTRIWFCSPVRSFTSRSDAAGNESGTVCRSSSMPSSGASWLGGRRPSASIMAGELRIVHRPVQMIDCTESMRLSILVPFLNRHELTLECLSRLEANAAEEGTEILAFDNGSRGGTLPL